MPLNCASLCIMHYHCMIYSRQTTKKKNTENKPIINMIKHDTAKDVYVLLKYHKLTSEKLITKQCGSLCHGLRVMHTF